MKKYLLLFIVGIMSITFANAEENETRHFGEFHSVYFFGNIEVLMIKSDSNYAELSSDSYPLGKITTEIKKGQLVFKNNGIGDSKVISVKFYYKSIDELIAKAGVKLKARDTIYSQNFSIRLSKGATVDIMVDNKIMTAIVLQGSELIISGKVENLDVTSNSGGMFEGFKLKAKDVVLRAVTGGKIQVRINGNMNASTHTGGMIYYKGTPKIVSQKAASGGIIEKAK